MEPVQRVMGPAPGVQGAAAVHLIASVARREPDPEEERRERRRRTAPSAPAAPAPSAAPAEGGLRRDADGTVHVDVRA